MTTLGVVALAVGIPLFLVAFWQLWITPRLRRGPSGDAVVTFATLLTRWYVRLVHRVHYDGLDVLPSEPGPLIVVANHGSALDPFLIQSGCPFFIHWMMARDQMAPGLEDIWRATRVIPTDRLKGDPSAARAALRLLKAGKVVGIFPEGQFSRPHDQLLPFHDGVGTLVSRTRARVLLACVDGTPETTHVAGAFFRPSRSRVRFLDVLTFPAGTEPSTITATLRDRLLAETGWTDCPSADPLPRPPGPFLG
ncbi:MAG: 1-acyl-sn-glycerol-3-phosphate acyltransferase [Phycisphaerales bacterium]|nr:1-acyl-sn-glycerol-3-phosphate acyltransferase [Phycisphaerales bacterium]